MDDIDLKNLEIRISNAKRIKQQIKDIQDGIATLEDFKMHSGNSVLVGYSGKIDDDTPLGKVRLNDFSCARSVLDLMIKTGMERLEALEGMYSQM